MGCTFCATGTMGLTGNLTAGEILEQLAMANELKPIRNLVFMGESRTRGRPWPSVESHRHLPLWYPSHAPTYPVSPANGPAPLLLHRHGRAVSELRQRQGCRRDDDRHPGVPDGTQARHHLYRRGHPKVGRPSGMRELPLLLTRP